MRSTPERSSLGHRQFEPGTGRSYSAVRPWRALCRFVAAQNAYSSMPCPYGSLSAGNTRKYNEVPQEGRMKHFLTLALVVVSLSAYSQTKDHPSGEIKGTVTDENGNAVSAATVCVVPQDISLDSITPTVDENRQERGFRFWWWFPVGSVQAVFAKRYRCLS
jgi:hypothetical protein